MPRKKLPPKRVAILDFETDPFVYGRIPAPFACGILVAPEIEGTKPSYVDFWGIKCVSDALDYLASITVPLIIYAHNGGKFDFHFFLSSLENPIKVINGRIVKAKIGIHEFRDSWAIIPMPLAAYQKEVIDYAKFESNVRDSYKAEIREYLYSDCLYLYNLVSAFVLRFGFRLTIAGTAGKELRKLHPQFNGKEDHDRIFRPFYYGGRVECFGSGILKGNWNVYDVNSMYPFVMRNCVHPLGTSYVSPHIKTLDSNGWIKGFSDRFYFCRVTGLNHGALPIRLKGAQGGGLSFREKSGTFYTTSHELRAALSMGIFTVIQIEEAYIPRQTQNFAQFVDVFSAEKIAAKKAGDKIKETFAKLILNSAYGRFGINPFEFYDYYIQLPGTPRPNAEFEPLESNDSFTIWRARIFEPVEKGQESNVIRGFEDVAIAASITSAARAVLMRAVFTAQNPVYCDTDSIICEQLTGQKFSDTELGAWKYEGCGTTLALAGKKLYALFDHNGKVALKGANEISASKGVRISAREILAIAGGETIAWHNEAPSFSLLQPPRFVKRNISLSLRALKIEKINRFIK